MVNIVDGDLLNATEDIICHQTNCQGVMGSGIALQIKKEFPLAYGKYAILCNKYSNKRSILLGQIQIVDCGNKCVASIFGQEKYGRDKVYTNYQALYKGIKELVQVAKSENKSIAMPYKIGCGSAGGDWKIVLLMLNEITKDLEYNITLYRKEE